MEEESWDFQFEFKSPCPDLKVVFEEYFEWIDCNENEVFWRMLIDNRDKLKIDVDEYESDIFGKRPLKTP